MNGDTTRTGSAATATGQLASRISGIVKDDKMTELNGAIISLLRSRDTGNVKVMLSTPAGAFEFKQVPPGDYLIKVSYIGFKPFFSTVIQAGQVENIDLGAVIMLKNENENELKGVVVTARRPVVQQKIDMTVININETVLKEASNALEILRLAPGVLINDNEDGLTMNGKDGVDIMLNGKLVHLSGRDLLKLLKSMPAASVNQVEVIANPSAKYDIQGNKGILNIRTKRNETEGITGDVSLETSQGTHNMGDYSASLNYGLQKVFFTGYTAFHNGNYQTDMRETRFLQNGPSTVKFDKNSTSFDKWKDPVIRVGMDYFINSKHTLGALVEMEKSTNTGSYENITNIGKNGGTTDSTLFTSSRSPNTRHWNTYNLNYHFTDTLGSELNVDIDRSYFKQDKDNTLLSSMYTPPSAKFTLPANFLNTSTVIDILTLKADFSKSYRNNVKLEAGLKAAFVKTDNQLLASYEQAGNVKIDSNLSNKFKYKENVNAAYISVGKTINKWGIQAGLRLEQSIIKGVSTDEYGTKINKPDSTYYNLLPSVFVSFQPSDNHALRLSVIQKIKRPAYEDLQPFTYQIDLLNYHLGNPSLKAQINTNAELSYTYKNKVTLTAAYTHTKNYFTPVIFQDGNILYQNTDNTGTEDDVSFGLTYPLKMTKWWTSNNKASYFYNYFKGRVLDGDLSIGKWSYTLYSSQRFVLPGKFVLTLTGRYNAPSQQLYYYDKGTGSVGLSLGKKLFNNRSIVRGGIQDIFFNQRTFTKVNYSSLNYTQYSTWESRRVFIEFSYRFGSDKRKQPRDRETGNQEEKGRAGK